MRWWRGKGIGWRCDRDFSPIATSARGSKLAGLSQSSAAGGLHAQVLGDVVGRGRIVRRFFGAGHHGRRVDREECRRAWGSRQDRGDKDAEGRRRSEERRVGKE